MLVLMVLVLASRVVRQRHVGGCRRTSAAWIMGVHGDRMPRLLERAGIWSEVSDMDEPDEWWTRLQMICGVWNRGC